MKKFNLTLIVCILIPVSLGVIAGIGTASNINDWYAGLHKPFFNPPNYLFGPVWTVLYILMGISLYLVWQAPPSQQRTNAVVIFGIQMALNFVWSFIFFYFHQISLALLDISILWISILMMIIVFYGINRKAAYLQIPYLLWVSFATTLNAAIWTLN